MRVPKLERAAVDAHRRFDGRFALDKDLAVARELFLGAHDPARAIGYVDLHGFVSVARRLVGKSDGHVEGIAADALNAHAVVAYLGE